MTSIAECDSGGDHAAKPEKGTANNALLWYLLLIVVLVALNWRTTVIESFPNNYHLPRYYAGVLRTRMVWMYLHEKDVSPAEAAWLENTSEQFGEPPILEALTVLFCTPLGSVDPRVASVISCIAWFVGGWFVFRAAALVVKNRFAALATLAFYLLCPLAIVMSQAVQPEGIMTLAFVIAIWLLVRFPPDGTWRRTMLLAAGCGLASFVKPGVLFCPILGAYLGMRLSRDSLLKVITDGRAIAFGSLMLIPSVIWVASVLHDRVDGKLMPAMLLDPSFYSDWFQRIDETMGWWVVVVLVAGAVVLLRRFHSALGLGLIGGYLIYAMAFPWHTATHSYYQVPLIPIAAICVAPLVALLLNYFEVERLGRGPVVLTTLIFLAMVFWYPTQSRRIVDLSERIDVVETLGLDRIQQHVAPNTSVLCFDPLSGYPLLYHCLLHSHSWPRYGDHEKEIQQTGTSMATEVRFKELTSEFDPQYFIITANSLLQLLSVLDNASTDSERARILESLDARMSYNSQVLLFLEENYPRLATDKDFVIYDLREKGNS